MLQTGLDLRSVVTTAAAGQQHCGERQRSEQEDQANTERTLVHRLDSPAIQKGSQAGEREQEFKYRASLHVGGHLIVEEIERGIDGHTTVDLTNHKRLAVDILEAWIQQDERVETGSSELWDLRNQLSEDRA